MSFIQYFSKISFVIFLMSGGVLPSPVDKVPVDQVHILSALLFAWSDPSYQPYVSTAHCPKMQVGIDQSAHYHSVSPFIFQPNNNHK
jgi:hypothetical protein